ncbi:hypothetical protein [Natronomonas marina]|jgi:hypothetical protein|uniref:hypothetical protein n=1 Tax=Natronomonas marina TaxID=2961939 RepID=UPI0020C98C8A|nr:hypothetical protein [Natronomonas marina]
MDERIAGDWDEAITLARSLEEGEEVRLSKSVEPALPADIDLRRSNFPWSIHKGATAVYRERERGRHLQIREYPAAWVVSTDSYNPRYRPIGHATVDIPATMLIAMGTLTPVQSYRWVFGDRFPSPASTLSFTASTVEKSLELGKNLLPLP